ncbi:sulfite exporter TauE/SafE family protein [Flexithrix dorotheae]|uniref:sulfite exporter TauE/SafE family protein n=1 Tax=Flexithrix dorotheae TaxID=70993 RepID=UPI0005C6D165|nr:sulfite exporter TauE/SafE family protein [Flexithrix dorotheae]
MEYSLFDLSNFQIFLIMLSGILIGMSKSGLSGAGMVAIPIFALTFGGKASTGVLLPLLVFADIYAVAHYRRHANIQHLYKLLPWVLAGLFIGIYIGNSIPDILFKRIIAIGVIVSILLLIFNQLIKSGDFFKNNKIISPVFGTSGGFTTMVGNAAGPIMSVYFLSKGMLKNSFIGTKAWFFLLLNLFKIPLHIFFWGTITVESFLFDLQILPSILLGVFIGIKVVKIIPESAYRIFVIIVTLISSILLFF